MIHRRTFLLAGAATLGGPWLPRRARGPGSPARPLPTAAQLAWQRDELAMFCHFGVNTFTNREWGDGTEDPMIFAPAALDARQWARAARAAGCRAMILTAKHHDGFCLWPSRTTTHSVAHSPWRAGDGDLVREFVEACRAEGLRPGLYVSPWDRNHPAYGDSDRYNDVYDDQLTELLTNYGPQAEIWFDGANGEGPNGRRQVYDWPRVWATARRLQPDAVVFSDAGPDVRWCGNERGSAGDPNWSTIDPAAVPYPGATGSGIIDALQHGDPNGTVWRPAEADVSIRPGWFYHPDQDDRVRPVDNLVDLYFQSVGRNSKLLLNVPPTPAGLLHEIDVARLAEWHDRLRQQFAGDLVAGIPGHWSTGAETASAEFDLGRTAIVSVVRLAEDTTQGQVVSGYVVEGAGDAGEWRALTDGSTIGYARLARFDPVAVRRLRVRIHSDLAPPPPVSVEAYGP